MSQPSASSPRISSLRLSWLLLWRDFRARELNLLLMALLVAVAAVTTVGFFVDRLDRALNEQALHLLGADLVVRADRPVPEAWAQRATASGLQVAHTVSFPSMAMADHAGPQPHAGPQDRGDASRHDSGQGDSNGQGSNGAQGSDGTQDGGSLQGNAPDPDVDEELPPTQLASVLAVSQRYPLRGVLTVTPDAVNPDFCTSGSSGNTAAGGHMAGTGGKDAVTLHPGDRPAGATGVVAAMQPGTGSGQTAGSEQSAGAGQAAGPGRVAGAAVQRGNGRQATPVPQPGTGKTSSTSETGEMPGLPIDCAPAPGTVFVDEALAQSLDLKLGERLALGNRSFVISRFILMEPSRGASFVNFAPRLMLALDDLPSTGLTGPGSRLTYGLLVAGPAQAMSDYQTWLRPQLGAGQHLENLDDGRPEIQNTLTRARQFLALVSLLSALIAAVAIGLGARRFAERHLDGFAILKAMGLSQRLLARALGLEMLWLALAGGVLGVTLGWAAHHALIGLARVVLETSLPAASAWPALQALLVAVVLVLGFAAVPVLRLSGITPLRVLRRDLGAPGLSVWLVLGMSLGAFAVLLLWLVGDTRLALLALGGFVLAAVVFVLLAMGGVWLASRLRPRTARPGWGLILRLALTGWSRRLSMTAVQIVALTVGLMALLLLTVIRNDLLAAWQQAAPPDAPNRFVINIQPDQQRTVHQILDEAGLGPVTLYPMVRGRLVAINDRSVRPEDYSEDRARRLVDREFNLSYASQLPAHNQQARGRWIDPNAAEVSAETGIMDTLGLSLGDRLRFDVGGQTSEMTLVGARELKWDSMQVNFFMIGSPAVLASQPQNLITAFHVPAGKEGVVRRLSAAMPNLTIIDTGVIGAQIQSMIGQVVSAVQFLFLFTVAAGCVVLYAAMGSLRDERVAEVALMRALGASRRQLGLAQLVELSATGLLAGLMGAAGATLMGWQLARQVFDFAYQPSPWLLAGSILASTVFIVLAGGWNVWRLLDTPPLRALRGS